MCELCIQLILTSCRLYWFNFSFSCYMITLVYSFVLVMQGERKIPVLIGICILFTFHVAGVYWWYRNDDILYPLIMLPPKAIPPFWHAVFIIMVNGVYLLFFHSSILYHMQNGIRVILCILKRKDLV